MLNKRKQRAYKKRTMEALGVKALGASALKRKLRPDHRKTYNGGGVPYSKNPRKETNDGHTSIS